MTEQLIEGAQGRLFVSSSDGEGEAVVFVHSDAGRHEHWDDARRALKQRTVAFDRRGHGRSDAPVNGSFEREEGAEDILAVADALDLDTFTLVGHSGGASDAFAFAGLHHERLSGLVLVDPPPDPRVLPMEMMEQQLQALHDNYRPTVEGYYLAIAGDDARIRDRVLADVVATPQATVIGTVEAMIAFHPTLHAGHFGGPTVAIIQPQFDVDGAIHRIPPGFRHVAIGDAGHWIHLGAPDKFASALGSFLDRPAAYAVPTKGRKVG